MRGVVCAAFFAGFALSWKLWFVGRTYPLSPMLPFLPGVPTGFDLLLLPVACIALGMYAVRAHRVAGFIFLGLLAVACFFDINRLQPWVWQYALFLGALLAGGSEGEVRGSWRTIVGCTYLWSGILKLNPRFLASGASWMLQPFVAPIGPDAAVLVAFAMLLIEIAVGVLLLANVASRVAASVGILMHLFILLSIGPLGHDWNSVVWPWNVFMIVALLLLWLAPTEMAGEPVKAARRTAYGKFLLVAVGILPLFAVFGWWDSYLSFALYTANVDQSSLIIPADSLAAFPRSAVGAALPVLEGMAIDLMPWAMHDLNVPPYPEERAYKGVLRYACDTLGVSDARLVVQRGWSPLFARGAGGYGCEDVR
jgi:hypothetical protein